MPSTANSTFDLLTKRLPLPKLTAPPKKSFFDLRNPGLVLIIWDILLGIPFSLFITFANRGFMRWLGYEKLMGCPPGIFANRFIMVLVNLWVIWSWRMQLVQEEREERVRAEIKMLDEVIACLEKVLAGVEAKAVEEQLVDDNVKIEEVGELILDKKGWSEWNQKKKKIARKIRQEI